MREVLIALVGTLMLTSNLKIIFPVPTSYINSFLSLTLIFIIYLLYALNTAPLVVLTFIVLILTNIFVVAFMFLFYDKQHQLLFTSINSALILFVFAWYLQFFVYYITGHYIDFLQPITGEAQRYQAYFSSSSFFIRPTSLFNEPGTYAMATLPYLVLSYLENRKLTRLHYFTLASYFLSLSLFAIVVAAGFMIIVMLYKILIDPSINKGKMISIFLIVSSILLIGIKTYNDYRFNSAVNLRQIDIRTNVINGWLAEDEFSLLFGNGFDINEKTADATDTSLYFRVVYDYGVLSLPLFILCFYMAWGLPLFFVLIVFLTKISYFHYLFWYFMAALMVLNQRKRDSNN
ncbi:MAG: hypothetical protein PHQ90_00150 [Sulfuricurvum sp.]|nr:hypothetical protein [Sulfuricurvum sp.]